MKRHGLEIVYKDYNDFEAYASAINRQILWRIYLFALVFEVIYYMLVLFGQDIDGLYSGLINLPYFNVQPLLLVAYVLMLLLITYFYEKFTRSVTSIALSFLFFSKLILFVHHSEGVSAFIIWTLLVLILSWQFMIPWIFLPVVGFSFTYLIYGLLHDQVDITSFAPYLWMMMLSVVVSCIINIRSYKREEENFVYQQSLFQEKVTHVRQLNYDTMTRLYTKYAMDQFVDELSQRLEKNNVFVIVMDLDDLSYCNDQFGHEKGDDYIQTFGRIIKFLERNDMDRVARVSGDNFMAIIASYWPRDTLEKRLIRYNQLLKEEFDKKYIEDLFIPNFSYGIAEYIPGEDFEKAYANAEKQMQLQKIENKKHLSTTNYYLPNINYNTLFETGSIVAIAWLGSEGWPVAYVSRNIIEFLGYSNEVLLNGEVIYHDLIHVDDQRRIRKEVTDNLKQHVSHYEQTYRLKKSQGDYIWVRDHSVPVWEGESLVQINGTLYDITDTITAEEEVKEKSVWLNDIIEATNVGTWEWDILKGEVHCNDRFATMIGYTVSELTPIDIQSWRDLLLEEDRAAFEENMREHLEGRKPYYELECRVQHKNGSVVWIYDRGRIMKRTEEGIPWIMIGSQSDITELKQIETMLYHSEKLNALGRLSGGIAHDMNNQLMMISSMAEISDKQDTYETYKKNNQLIGDVVDKSRALMHQLLSFTKHRTFNPQKMDVVVAIEDTVNILSHTFGKEIEIRTIMAIDEGLVEADRSALDNVFINLSINAKEAMGDGGQLLITVDKYHASKRFHTYTGYLQEGDYIEVRFSDSGCGIEQESLKKVFEPFYSTKEGGSGIGLSTAVSAVRAHKGGIKVQSRIGLGTVFTLLLPKLNESTIQTDLQIDNLAKKGQSGSALKVMVVDDEPVICEVLSDYLSMQGWQVVHFEDPDQALEYATSHQTAYDCVILDIMMPTMSGVELYDALRALNAELPVLFLSGYSEGIHMNEAYKDNIIDFIEKPAKLEEIYHTIAAWYNPLVDWK